MKKIFTKISSKKGLSVLFVAGVLVLVLILNLAVGIFSYRGRFLTDLTSEGLYTVAPIYRTALTDTFRTISDKRAETGDDPVRVRILFCEDPDVLSADSAQRYIYFTALSLQKMFPDYISVDCVDVALNPTAVPGVQGQLRVQNLSHERHRVKRYRVPRVLHDFLLLF